MGVKGATTFNVDGVLTSNAIFSPGAYGNTTFNVGGEMNLLRGSSDIGSSKTITVNVKDGGRLNVAGYDRNDDNRATFNLAAGATLGAIEDTAKPDYVIVRNVVNLGANGVTGTVTIDTDLSTAAADTYVVSEKSGEDAGAQMVLDGTITSLGTTKMAVTGSGTLHVAGNAQVSGGVEVEQGAALAVSKVSVNATYADSTLEQYATITAADGANAATVDGAVSISHTDGAAAIAGEDENAAATMNNSLITIAQGASLTVNNMIISESSRITGQTAATFAARTAGVANLTATNTTVVLGSGNASVAGQAETMDLGTLQATGSSDASGALTLGADSKVLTVSTDVFSNLALTSGTDFVVDFSSLLSSIHVADADFVYLSFADTVSADWSTTPLTGTWNDYQMDAYYHTAVAVGAAVPNVGVYFDVRAIPEPTSTTLSILALAALAARRRRK